MKTKLRIKQISKLIIHSLLLTGFIALVFGFQYPFYANNNEIIWQSPIRIDLGHFITGLLFVPYIVGHMILEWLLEHTPLKTKELKRRVYNIKDSKTINDLDKLNQDKLKGE